MVISAQSRAILWAQWRSLWNLYPRSSKGSTVVVVIGSLIWYSVWMAAAIGAALFLGETRDLQKAYQFLAPGLVIAILYWQVIPIMMVSTGASLQVKKLRVYPIAHSELFGLEALLRISTGFEMLILIVGMTVGLAMSPVLPLWPAIVFIPFLMLNLFVAAGMRELMVRFFSQKRTREIGVFVIALAATLPQLLFSTRSARGLGRYLSGLPAIPWPWTATAHIVTGQTHWRHWLTVLAWMGAAYVFGRVLFEKGLRFDEEAARSSTESERAETPVLDRIARLIARVLRDPVGAIFEKEVRTLLRSSSFRLLFLMGFTFGLLIWLPMKMRARVTPDHFFVLVCGYAMLLLSDVLIWNFFGFDRSAAQFYLLAPVRVLDVLIAKNLTAFAGVFLEILALMVVCVAAGFVRAVQPIFDSFLVCAVSLLFLLGIGNWSSIKYPRPVDPNQSWKRGHAGRFRFLLLIIYPAVALPFAFAYFARDVWESDWAFYGTVGFLAVAAVICYRLWMESALEIAKTRRETFLRELSQSETPITSILQS